MIYCIGLKAEMETTNRLVRENGTEKVSGSIQPSPAYPNLCSFEFRGGWVGADYEIIIKKHSQDILPFILRGAEGAGLFSDFPSRFFLGMFARVVVFHQGLDWKVTLSMNRLLLVTGSVTVLICIVTGSPT
jgi:hypothetical protein